MIANKLNPGDEIRVIAPSRNLTEVWNVAHHHAVNFWQSEGFRLTFSKHSSETNQFHSSSISSRVEDLHEAFSDPNVKMVITCLGGFNANQLLRHLDYELIANNPNPLNQAGNAGPFPPCASWSRMHTYLCTPVLVLS